MKQEVLQPIDIIVCLKLSLEVEVKSFKQLEKETGIASSTLHRAVNRLQHAGLLSPELKVSKKAFLNFLKYGVKYAFYVTRGELTRGMPTAYAAAPLNKVMNQTSELPVWPDLEGSQRGFAVTPLHPQVIVAAKKDATLYELLALVDALRIGNAREYKLASDLLEKKLLS